jgi:hypothetical protein
MAGEFPIVAVWDRYSTSHTAVLLAHESEDAESHWTKLHAMIWPTFVLCWRYGYERSSYSRYLITSTTFTYPVQWRHKVVITHNGKSQECVNSYQNVYDESPWLSSFWSNKRHRKLLYSRRCAVLSARMHCRDSSVMCKCCGLSYCAVHTEADTCFSSL